MSQGVSAALNGLDMLIGLGWWDHHLACSVTVGLTAPDNPPNENPRMAAWSSGKLEQTGFKMKPFTLGGVNR